MAWQEKINNLPNVRKDVDLSGHTTLGVGGMAEYYLEALSSEDLMRAVVTARSIGAPYRVIGLGSNVIISDTGIEGLVIVNRSKSLQIDYSTGRVIADSGVPLSRVILEAATFGLGGLEPLYGIPGTVGGAVIVNAGAHGVDIGSFLRSASVLVSSEKIINCKPNWFKFGYRTSKLKGINSESAPVVVSVIFQFQRRKKEDILEKIGEFKKWRSSHQPIGEKTCGSIFKNPAGTDDAQGGQKEKTAGYILEQAGAKRLVVDGVRVAKIHSNWVINNGKAKAFDVRSLIEKMRSVVEEKFSLTLVEEVEYLGRWDEPRYQ